HAAQPLVVDVVEGGLGGRGVVAGRDAPQGQKVLDLPHRQRPAGAAAREPVPAVGGQAQQDLPGRDLGDGVVQDAAHPVQGADGTGRPAVPAVVVGHDGDVVHQAAQGGVVVGAAPVAAAVVAGL